MDRNRLAIRNSGALLILMATGLVGTGCMGWFKTRPGPPTSEYVYVATGTNVAQYVVDPTGQLIPLVPATAPSSNPVAIETNANGHFAYAANRNLGNISQFSIGKDGTLTALNPATVPAGVHPVAIASTPNSLFLYVINGSDNTISQYSVADNGQLSPLSPATVTLAAGGNSMVISPNGLYLYAASPFSSTLSAFSIAASGQLSPLTIPTYTLANPQGPTISPNGNFMYVPISGPAVAQFAVGGDGSLTALAPPTATTPSNGNDCAAVTPNGSFCYIGEFNGGVAGSPVAQFAIGGDGTLGPLAPTSVAAGNAPAFLAVDPAGAFTYVANLNDGTVSEFSVAPGGQLTPLSPATVNPTGAMQIAFAVR